MADPIRDTGNFAVRACAGSGKTYTLVNRYLHRMLGTRPRMLAITFTELAAAEMKQRIATDLVSRQREAERKGDTTEAERLRGILFSLPEAEVRTFHSFCSSLAQEFAPLLGLPPVLPVLDDIQAHQLKTEAAFRAIEAAVQQVSEPAGSPRAVAARIALATSSGRLVSFLRTTAGDCLWSKDFVRCAAEGHFNDRNRPVPSAVREALDLLRSVGLPTSAAPLEAESGNWLSKSGVRAVSVLKKIPGFAGRIEDDELLEIGHAVRDAVAYNKGLALAVCEPPLMSGLAALVSDALDRYTALKGDAIDYDDMIRLASEVLLSGLPEREEAVRAVQDRFSHVFVDEFQDTDSLQWRIVCALCGSMGRIPPDRLFIVGDDQQAIYGFRGADIETFRAARESLGRSAEVSLTINRRSSHAVIGFCNDIFARLFSVPGFDPQGIQHLPMTPHKDLSGSVSFHFVRKPAHEAALTAKLVAREYRRQLELSGPDSIDIAVLARKNDLLVQIAPLLSREGVPFTVRLRDPFSSRREIQDIRAFLACLLDPSDDLAHAHFLRSALCGLSDHGLFTLTRGGVQGLRKGLLAVDLSLLDKSDRDAVVSAQKVLEWASLAVLLLPLEVFLDELLEALGAPFAYGAGHDGAISVTSLNSLRELVAELGAKGGGLADLVLALRTPGDPSPGSARKQPGAVNLLTIHSSKGLEFGSVFLAGAGDPLKTAPPGATIIRMKDAFGKQVPVPFFRYPVDPLPDISGMEIESEPDESGAKTVVLPWSGAALSELKDRETAEAVRLLYVASTRAVERLFLVGRRKENAKGVAPNWFDDSSYLGAITSALRVCTGSFPWSGAERGEVVSPSFKAEWHLHTPDPLKPRIPLSLLESRVAQLGPVAFSEPGFKSPVLPDGGFIAATTLAKLLAGSPAEHEATDDASQPRTAPRDDAVVFGNAFHAVMEQYPQPVEAAVSRLVRSGMVPSRMAKELTAMASRTLQIPAVREALASDGCLHEWPFLLTIGPFIVRGKVDLLAPAASPVRIVDFKTGVPLREGQPGIEEYRWQLAIYSQAVQSAFGSPALAHLVFTRDGSTVAGFSPSDILLRFDKIGLDCRNPQKP